MRQGLLQNVAAGEALLPVIKHISQEKINLFAAVTGAVGQVHLDAEFCKKFPFKTTLAHGYLIMAYLCEMMENNFGTAWMVSGELDVKFTGVSRPGDSIVVLGAVTEVSSLGETVTCEVRAMNQNNDIILTGSTKFSKK